MSEDAKTAEKPTSRQLVALAGPKDLDTKAKRRAWAESFADDYVKIVQSERKRLGLPPLPKE